MNEPGRADASHAEEPPSPLVITPSEVEASISGVFRIEISPDKTVSLIYEDRSRISARLEVLSHEVKSNVLNLVRSVQNAAKAEGQRLESARLA